MSTRIECIIVFILIVTFSSKLDASSYLNISSIDNKQSIRVKMEKIKVYYHYKLDSNAIISKMQTNKYDVFNLDKYLIKSSTSKDSFVFFTKNINRNKEGEVSIFLLGLYDGGLKELYYIEHEQGKWFWKLNDGIMEVEENRNVKIKINAKLESVKFSLSGLIDFPYNKDGGYDMVKRYLKIKGEWGGVGKRDALKAPVNRHEIEGEDL
jgi:hypothetical protein